MKSIKKILTVFTSTCFILGSCDIDPTLTSSYPSDIIWSNESNLITYINGYYSLVGGYYGLGGEACTDMLKQNNPVSDYNQFVFGSMPITTTSNMFDTWGGSHSSQLSLTRFLENLEKNRTNFSDSIATLAEAQVRFFRGVTCFNLAKCYGGQYIIYRQLPVLGEKNHPLCSSQEGWDFIYEDLRFAAEHLPTKDKVELGCLSSGAAYGMLARAMLYAERWKEASDAAAQVMNQDYELYEDYGKLFTNSRLVPVENKESVIEFGYLKDKFTYSFDYFYCPPSDGGYAEISPTEDLVSSYQMADGSEFDWDNPEMAANPYEGREPRFYATILYNGCQWKGETLYTYEGSKDGFGLGGGTTSTGYYMRKLMKEAIQPKGTSFTGQGDLTYYYMRYAVPQIIKWGELRVGTIYSSNVDDAKLQDFNMTASNPLCDYSDLYKVINMANSVILYAPGVRKTDDTYYETVMNSHLCEAYFQRAYSYLLLLKNYKEVPLITEPYVNDKQSFQIRR